MITPPREPIGHSKDSLWLRDLLRYVKSISVKEGTGYTRNVTSEGTILQINPGGGSSTPPPALSIARFRLKSISANVLVCRTWDGTTEGTTDTMVAKPTKLRAIENELIDSVFISYQYPSNTDRIASADSIPSEQQNIVPRYLIPYTVTRLGVTYTHNGDEIFAAQFEDPIFLASGIPVYYVDLNVDGRAWAKKYGT